MVGTVLDKVKFEFYQDTNGVDGNSDDAEELDVTCLSHFGINDGDSFFMNIKTGSYGWSIENPQEFYDLLTNIAETVKFAADRMNMKEDNK